MISKLEKREDYREKFVRAFIGGAGHKFYRTDFGYRILDNYLPDCDKAIEVKTGYVGLGWDTRTEIEKDRWLIYSNLVTGIEWWFVDSPNTGKGGPSSRLADALADARIKIKFYSLEIRREPTLSPRSS